MKESFEVQLKLLCLFKAINLHLNIVHSTSAAMRSCGENPSVLRFQANLQGSGNHIYSSCQKVKERGVTRHEMSLESLSKWHPL